MGFVSGRKNRNFLLIVVLIFWIIQQMLSTQLIAEEIEPSPTEKLESVEEVQINPSGKFEFVPALSVYEVYDDNIFFGEEERLDDFITLVSPSAVLSYEVPKARISATYMSGLEFFYQYPDQNTTQNQNASLNLSMQPTKRINVDVTDSMAFYAAEFNRGYGSRGGGLGYFGYYGGYRREEDVTLPPEERTRGYTDMLAYPNDYWSNSVNASLSYELSESIDTRVGYYYGFCKYSETAEEAVRLEDSTQQGYQASLDYRRSVRDTFSLGYDYRTFSYTREVDTDVHSITAGWAHLFSPTLSLDVNAGLMFISGVYGYDTDEDEVGWRMATRLTKSFRRASIGLGYTRDVNAYGGMGGTGISQTYSLDIIGRPTKRLDASINTSYRCYRPTTEEPGRVSLYYQDLKIYSGGLTMGYAFTRRLRGTFSYSYTHQTLGQTEGDMDYHQAMGGFEYALTRWLNWNLIYTYSNYSFPLLLDGGTRDVNIYDNRIMLGLSFTWQQ